mmetsp:Transcript_16493/g.33929  ORF Transcript_16493/g.33929 Transcript_16493/m.33929 type:complete len:200 (-) Transcript_16493:674-1273(-)
MAELCGVELISSCYSGRTFFRSSWISSLRLHLARSSKALRKGSVIYICFFIDELAMLSFLSPLLPSLLPAALLPSPRNFSRIFARSLQYISWETHSYSLRINAAYFLYAFRCFPRTAMSMSRKCSCIAIFSSWCCAVALVVGTITSCFSVARIMVSTVPIVSSSIVLVAADASFRPMASSTNSPKSFALSFSLRLDFGS